LIRHLDKHIFLTILVEDKTYCIDHSFERINYLLKKIISDDGIIVVIKFGFMAFSLKKGYAGIICKPQLLSLHY